MNKILFCILFFISASQSQSLYSCKGKFDNYPSNNFRRVVIEYWSEDRWLESDTANLGADFSFYKPITHAGVQARLRIHGQSSKWIDFYIPSSISKDSVFDFGTIDYNLMNGTPAALADKENEMYAKLISDYKKYKNAKDNANANDAALNADALKKIDESQSVLNNECKEAEKKLKGTFTGDVLSKLLYIPVQKDYTDKRILSLTPEEFERKHLLDKIPFDDKRILTHNALIKALNNFQSKFSRTDSTELYHFIDRVMYKRQGNAEVDAWLFHYMFNKFVGTKDDISLTYLLKYYLSDCEADESNTSGPGSMLNALRNCEVGKKAFQFNLPNLLGTHITLSEIASQHKLTLLFFWRSDCSHCREFEPELIKIYDKYKSSGLEIIGVSLDKDELKWKIYLQTTPMPWINLLIPDHEQRDLINANYPIPGTPTLISVDSKSIVLNRMINRNNLENYLDQALLHIETRTK